jgi:hypothetical protein
LKCCGNCWHVGFRFFIIKEISVSITSQFLSIREGCFSVPARHAILEAPCTKVLAVITSSLASHSILYQYSTYGLTDITFNIWPLSLILNAQLMAPVSIHYWHQLTYTIGTS